MTVALLPCVLFLTVTHDAVEDLLVQAARFPDGATGGEAFREDLTAAFNAQTELIARARRCPGDEWPTLRERLIIGLDSCNRGVWLACCQALARREPEALAAELIATLQRGSDPGREALAARALSRVAGHLSPEVRNAAAAVLVQRIEELDRPCDRERLLGALGSLGEAATEPLLQIAANPVLFDRVRSALPDALASTGDRRALPLLLALHAGVTDEEERVSTLLALGQLVHRVTEPGPSVDQAVAALRADFERHVAPAVAAAAALALVRAGHFRAETDGARIFELAAVPAARRTALRAVLESRMVLTSEQRQVVEAYARDEASDPAVRKLARALLAE